MRKKNKRSRKHKRIRRGGRSKQIFNAFSQIEKSDKANHRRKLKLSIKLRLKKLTSFININSRYL